MLNLVSRKLYELDTIISKSWNGRDIGCWKIHVTQKNIYFVCGQHALWLNLKHKGQKGRKVDRIGKTMLDSITNRPQITKV